MKLVRRKKGTERYFDIKDFTYVEKPIYEVVLKESIFKKLMNKLSKLFKRKIII